MRRSFPAARRRLSKAYWLVASLAATAALSACAAGCASTPDLRVSGVVLDAVTREPVAGARVHEGRYAPDLAAGAVTGEDGAFAYYSYPEEHCLLVEAPGYAAYSATIGLRPASRDERLSIELQREGDD